MQHSTVGWTGIMPIAKILCAHKRALEGLARRIQRVLGHVLHKNVGVHRLQYLPAVLGVFIRVEHDLEPCRERDDFWMEKLSFRVSHDWISQDAHVLLFVRSCEVLPFQRCMAQQEDILVHHWWPRDVHLRFALQDDI